MIRILFLLTFYTVPNYFRNRIVGRKQGKERRREEERTEERSGKKTNQGDKVREKRKN